MTRTDLDAHTLARSLRRMAGDGSVEWVMEPIQTDVLRDIADMLDENAELRETLKRRNRQFETMTNMWATRGAENAKLRELVRDAIAFLDDDDPCRHCGYDTECFEQNGLNVAYEGGCLMLGLLVNRARELGVEVNE